MSMLGKQDFVVSYLFQLGLFSLLLLAGFECLPVQRLGCELGNVRRLATRGKGTVRAHLEVE